MESRGSHKFAPNRRNYFYPSNYEQMEFQGSHKFAPDRRNYFYPPDCKQMESRGSLIAFEHQGSEQLYQLLTIYPEGLIIDHQWNFDRLSSHQHLPSRYVSEHLDQAWDYEELIFNENLSIGVRLEVIDYLHDNHIIVNLRDISELPLIKKLIEYQMINVESMVSNSGLTLESLRYLITQPEFDLNKAVEFLCTSDDSEVTKWLISQPNLEIDWNVIIRHCNLRDEQLFNQIIEWGETFKFDSYHYLLCNPTLSESQMIRLMDCRIFKLYMEPGDILNHPNCTINLSRLIFSTHKEDLSLICVDRTRRYKWFHQKTVMDESILEELMDILEPQKVLINKHCTSYILSIFINTSTLSAWRICDIVIKHYGRHDYLIDIEVISQLGTLTYSPSEIILAEHLKAIIEILTNEKLKGIEWKFGLVTTNDILLIPVIKNLQDVSRLTDQVYPKYIHELEFDCQVNEEMIILLRDQKWLRKVNMKKLTKTINHEIIIDHPELPWEIDILSTRKYYPSGRFFKTKKAIH